jgi:uncharacterized membrane protein YfcA
MDLEWVAPLLLAATAAGWVDAVVGGGGLLLLPMLLLALPGLPVATVLGTNKCIAITGTTTAAVTYARQTRMDWRVAGPSAAGAVIASGLGAMVAMRLPGTTFKPVVLAALIGVALLVVLRPSLGLTAEPAKRTTRRMVITIGAAGVVIACYDGLIGPGTGTFLVMTFTAVIGADFLEASAMAKLVNAGTNLGALLVFAWHDHVWWTLALGMAGCNVLGAVFGARMALRRGSVFVRVVLLVVVFSLVARIGYDLL